MAAEIAKLHISFTRKAGEEGKLFGSVTASEIGRVVVEKGFQIDRRKILLDMPIKQLGEHEVKIKLHPEVTGTITVEIKAEEPEPDLTAEPAEEKEETEE
jgi:large subunit ribosomal protein L9